MLSKSMSDVYDYARLFARSKRAPQLECMHILYALSVIDSEAKEFLNAFGLNERNLEPRLKGSGGDSVDSPEVIWLFSTAKKISEITESDCVSCAHVLIALLCSENTYAKNKMEFLLIENGSTPNDMLKYIVERIPNGDKFAAWAVS